MTEINRLQAKLTPYVMEIMSDAGKGDKDAQRIISLYRIYCDLPEPCCETLCTMTFETWLKKKGTQP